MPHRKLTNAIALSIAIILSAALVTLKPAPAEDSGVYGRATIAPTCSGPTRVSDTKCGPKPYAATLSIYTVKPNSVIIDIYPTPRGTVPVLTKVTTFTTDALGEFRVNLSPGQYVIRKDDDFLPRLPDILFTVTARKFTQADLPFDSGLR